MNGLTINAETLLAALGLDVVYGVNVQMPPDRACWHVRFRVHGRLRNLSCGTSVEADALKRAAEIFASEVGRGSCEEDPVHQRLNKVESILEVLVARGEAGGAIVPPIRPRVEKTLAEALEAYHNERATRDLSEYSEEIVAKRLRSFANHASGTTPLEQALSAELIAGWSEKKHDLSEVATFARWCAASPRKWVPAAVIDDLPVARRERRRGARYEDLLPPVVLRDLFTLLEKKHRKYLCFYAVAAFSGVRPNKPKAKREVGVGEIHRLLASVRVRGWSYHVREPGLWLPETKTGEGRFAYLPPTLRTWLAAYPDAIETPSQDWHRRNISRKYGIAQNTFRKTCAASYCTLFGPERAPLLFGNSQDMLRRFYVPGLIPEADSKAWFAILPSAPARTAAVASELLHTPLS